MWIYIWIYNDVLDNQKIVLKTHLFSEIFDKCVFKTIYIYINIIYIIYIYLYKYYIYIIFVQVQAINYWKNIAQRGSQQKVQNKSILYLTLL